MRAVTNSDSYQKAMMLSSDTPPQEQLNVVMQTSQLERGKSSRTLLLVGRLPEGAVANDLVRARLSMTNFLRRGREDENTWLNYCFGDSPFVIY